MPEEQYITLREASSLLEISSATLRNWDKKGHLKAVRNPVNEYRMYRLSDVLALRERSFLIPMSTPVSEIVKKIEDTKPSSSTDLRRLVRVLHRILRDCEGNSSLIERFDELTKILYCKVYDERQSQASSVSPAFSLRPDDTDQSVAQRIRKQFQSLVDQRPKLFPARFSQLNMSDSTIRRIVGALSTMRLASISEDLKGLTYEEIIRNTFDKGDNQQFFTPRSLVEFMVQILDSSLTGKICDPACGTGGFLLYVDKYMQQHKRASRVNLLGFEIDERLAWVTGINLDMHDASRFSVQHINSAGSLGNDLKPHFGTVDAIVTNPPFGSDLSETSVLETFALGKDRTSRRRGVLFIERCLDLLKPGGVVAIVIDDGALNGPSNIDTRQLIIERSHPFAIVSLPDSAFMPYASVKASILFLQKKGGRKHRMVRNHATFFGRAEVVGRKPNGDPLLRLNKATGKIELDSHLPDILDAWNAGPTYAHRLSAVSSERVFWSIIPQAKDDEFAKEGYRLDPAYHHPSRYSAVLALQSSPYPVKTILEICDQRNEAVVPSKDLREEEIAYLGLANIESHSGVCSPVIVNGSTLKSSVKRFIAGDILFSKMRPELRKGCLIPNDLDEGFASAECLVLTPKIDAGTGDPIMLPELLSILLRSDLVYGQVIHQVIGIGRPRLSKAVVFNVRLPVPTIREQRRLLQLHHRSEEASQTLIADSEKALEQARQIMSEARRTLIDDLLSPVEGQVS